MRDHSPLVRSIIVTMAALFLVETAVFCVLSGVFALGMSLTLFFLALEAGFYLMVLSYLLVKKAYFYNIYSGETESRVNFSNKITLFRITMLPFLICLIAAPQSRDMGPALVIATALTFLSDFVDGRLARAKKMETYIGKILDSASDYLLLGMMAGAFFFFAGLETWLFSLIMARLCVNTLGMLILFLIRKKLSPQTTFFGKAAIAAIMVLFVFEAATLLLGRPFWIFYIEAAAGLIAGLSIIDKIVYFVRSVRDT